MINNNIEAKSFEFKLGMFEKSCAVILIVLLIISLIGRNIILSKSFFYCAIVVALYYFAFYRRKTFYVNIESEVITIWTPFTFKPKEIKIQDIKNITVSNRIIEITSISPNNSNRIYSMLLKNDDWKELSDIISMWN